MKQQTILPFTVQMPEPAIKITEQQAKELGIDISKEEISGELKTFGMWQIPVSYKALCISGKLGIPEGSYTEQFIEKTFYGTRTMFDVKEGGYCLDGRVSINGKKYTCFTSSQLFEINGKLINVAVIHARVG